MYTRKEDIAMKESPSRNEFCHLLHEVLGDEEAAAMLGYVTFCRSFSVVNIHLRIWRGVLTVTSTDTLTKVCGVFGPENPDEPWVVRCI